MAGVRDGVGGRCGGCERRGGGAGGAGVRQGGERAWRV